MAHFIVVLNSAFGYSRTHQVLAERAYERDGMWVFEREGRVVHQAPTHLVTRVVEHETHAEAKKLAARLMDRHGAAALHVQELGSTKKARNQGAKRQGGLLAEGISVRIAGTARHPGRS